VYVKTERQIMKCVTVQAT